MTLDDLARFVKEHGHEYTRGTRLSTKEDCEDAFQEVCLALVERPDVLTPLGVYDEDKPETVARLARVVRKRQETNLTDMRRKRSRSVVVKGGKRIWKPRFYADGPDVEEILGVRPNMSYWGQDPAVLMERLERELALEQTVKALPVADRQLWELDNEGYKCREIAVITGIPKSTVSYRLRRIIRNLQEALDKY